MWLVWAIAASVTWGLDYLLAEKVIRNKVSLVSLMIIQMFLGALVFAVVGNHSRLKQDIVHICSNRNLLWLFIATAVSFNLGNFFIFLSIEAKNATLAGLIELSYPIFIILFSELLYKESQITPGVIVGGLLILAGAAVVTLSG